MKKCCPGYVLDVSFKREGGVKEDAEVTDEGGGSECGVVEWEGELICGFGDVVWSNDDNICFITVEFEEVMVHPVFNVCKAV